MTCRTKIIFIQMFQNLFYGNKQKLNGLPLCPGLARKERAFENSVRQEADSFAFSALQIKIRHNSVVSYILIVKPRRRACCRR